MGQCSTTKLEHIPVKLQTALLNCCGEITAGFVKDKCYANIRSYFVTNQLGFVSKNMWTRGFLSTTGYACHGYIAANAHLDTHLAILHI